MVEATRELTRRLGGSRVSGVEGYKNAEARDLASDNSPEPLNGMDGRETSLSLSRNVEGR